MSGRHSQPARRPDARRPDAAASRPRARSGADKPPAWLYAAALALVLVAAVGVAWAAGAFRGSPVPATPPSTARATAAGPVTEATAPAASAATEAAATDGDATASPTTEPVSAAGASAAAVQAAAVPYPDPPAVRPASISRGHPRRKLVAITLDDGVPFNMKTLELFEQRKVVCTTFLLGTFVSRNRAIVERLHRDGFEIANHTWDHTTLTRLSRSQVRSELSRTQAAISAITGNQAPYMRPPGGATNSSVKATAAAMGYRVVLWNKTFADTSRAATPQKLFHNVMDDLKPGDIILCHWGGRSTYEALQLILPEMERRGFTPVTLSEMLADS